MILYNQIMDNTVGSLTERQKSIITGKMLGDGSLRKKRNTLLEINHSHLQKDYVFWQYNELENLVTTPPKMRISGKNRIAYRFTTRSLESLNNFYSRFYGATGKKSIPPDLNLDPMVLAVWFMDDGSKDRDSVYLNTQQFDVFSQLRLLELLNSMRLKGSLNKDKSYFRIRLFKSSLPMFLSLVEPLLINSMFYKIPK